MKKINLYFYFVIFFSFSFVFNSNLNSYSKTSAIVSVEIDQIHIIEDRDYGSAEIYIKYTINNGTPYYSKFQKNVIDGDIIQFDEYIIANTEYELFQLRIEVWESDSLYNEGSNDYLGYVEISRNPVQNTSRWYDALGSIGGDSPLQARLYIIETLGYIEIKTNNGGDFFSDNFYILIIVALFSLIFIRSRRNSRKRNKYNQRRYNQNFRTTPVNNRYIKKDTVPTEEKKENQDIIDNESSNNEFEGKPAKSTND